MFSSLIPDAEDLTLTVRNRTQLVYQGPVKGITSVNLSGKFDVLPQHANFISIIKDYLILYKPDGSKERIALNRGVLKVDNQNVSVYLGVGHEGLTSIPLPQKK